MARIARLATVALMTGASIFALGAQPASADTAIGRCDPPIGQDAAVRTCVYMDFDNNHARSRAGIYDVDGGTNFDVDVTIVKIEVNINGTWVNADSGTRVEVGYQDATDTLVGSSETCTGVGRTEKLRAAARFRWRNPAGTEVYQWMHTDARTIGCTS